MRISDLSSDVCSSDLQAVAFIHFDALLICLTSAADGRLPHLHEAFHERHPDPGPGTIARGANAAYGARARDRVLARGCCRQIGRESRREEVCQYVSFSGGAENLKEKETNMLWK